MDTELDRIHLQWDTPVCKSAKKTVFGSIERGMDRIRTMLTPRKKGYVADLPRKVKVQSSVARGSTKSVMVNCGSFSWDHF